MARGLLIPCTSYSQPYGCILCTNLYGLNYHSNISIRREQKKPGLAFPFHSQGSSLPLFIFWHACLLPSVFDITRLASASVARYLAGQMLPFGAPASIRGRSRIRLDAPGCSFRDSRKTSNPNTNSSQRLTGEFRCHASAASNHPQPWLFVNPTNTLKHSPRSYTLIY